MNGVPRPLLQQQLCLHLQLRPLRLPLFIKRQTSSSPCSPFSSSPPTQKTPPTYYELFPSAIPQGAPPNGPFNLDPRALRQEFFKLQQLTHPDTVSDPVLKRQAEGGSAYLNSAYSTLLSPLLRAQYILQLRGIDVAEDETLKLDDQELLMEVLNAREEIEEAQTEDDLLPLRTANDERIEGSIKRLGEYFQGDNLESAKVEAVRLRYWINIKESLDAWEKGKPVVLMH